MAEFRGLNQTQRILDQLPDELDRAAQRELAQFVSSEVGRIQSRAGQTGRRERKAARSVRADGSTLIAAAGTGASAAMFYGAEFGGQRRRTTQQFRPFRGQRGYFMFPQLRDDDDRLADAFEAPADQVKESWD